MSIIKFNIHDGDVEVSIEMNQDKKDLIVDRIINYIIENNCSAGEVLHQSDNCIIDAPSCLSDIIDEILKPSTIYIG